MNARLFLNILTISFVYLLLTKCNNHDTSSFDNTVARDDSIRRAEMLKQEAVRRQDSIRRADSIKNAAIEQEIKTRAINDAKAIAENTTNQCMKGFSPSYGNTPSTVIDSIAYNPLTKTVELVFESKWWGYPFVFDHSDGEKQHIAVLKLTVYGADKETRFSVISLNQALMDNIKDSKNINTMGNILNSLSKSSDNQ